ncbi:sensor domain-containing diguanylate cyclase [Sulfurimonas sp.]|uniref:sensor domain-containing diguanylate cyclase n=1 Tax=Sulfurimonas sp. TaxID=2022749 RepID=UPI0019EE1BCD|nr:sensor domain-containing diguanylate cyclase [Sulfurimonas sp.]MBE0514506.1 GGDEF domain-containing protein [Sulfurimonas sp.]
MRLNRFTIVSIIVIAMLLLSGWFYIDFVEDSMRALKISKDDFNFFVYKWFSIALILSMIVAVTLSNYIYNKNNKQRMYYKNIIDSSSNIVVVVDKNNIVNVNKTFFKYFYKYKTLEEFKKEHSSISDFFVEEEGYVQRETEGKNWLESVIENPKNNQVKIVYDAKEYYFTVGVSLISEEDGHYSAIFSDITKEKLYQQELEHTNITDPLTKIKNRYYYNVQIKKESSNANRYFYPLSLVIFDIDHFKKINDSCGHDVGDAVLIEYTKLISSHLRDGDIFCRIGGEEFAFILPYINKSDAYKISDKIRAKVEAHKKIFAITMSFGVTEYIKGEDLEVTFKRADKALYEAKNAGRNKVVVR